MEITKARYGYSHKKGQEPKPRRKPRIIAVLLAMLTAMYSGLAIFTAPKMVEAEYSKSIQFAAEEVNIAWPEMGQAAIGSMDEGLISSSHDNFTPKPIASVTKIITALAVLDKQPLALGEQGAMHTLTAADAGLYSSYLAKLGSVMPVRQGQQLSQYQMLQAMLLPSANNIADTLAISIFGSMENYVEYANKMLRSYGLENTAVTDASGFSDNSVSTPADLIVIGQKALANEVIAQIVAQKQASIPESGVVKNTNLLLNDDNVIGIKTGTTDKAGSCLLFAVKHGPENKDALIGVVMGQPNWPATYRAVRTLRDSALAGYGTIEIVRKDQVLGMYKPIWGGEYEARAQDSLAVYGWRGKAYEAKVALDVLAVPSESGEVIGKVATEDSSVSANIILSEGVERPDLLWRLTNPSFSGI